MKVYNTKIVSVLITALALVAFGCGGKQSGSTIKKPPVDETGRQVISKEAREDFKKIAAEFNQSQKSGWNDTSCSGMVKKFEDLVKDYGMADAAYNVGVVHERCGDDGKAKKAFEEAMKNFPKSIPTQQRCLSYLAYMELKAGNVETAEEKLKRAVGLGRNTLEAVPAYTMAATILRDRAVAGDSAAWEKTQKALRTALAIDAKYIPALYQLSRLYYSIAVTLKKDSYLTLAMLVVDQARKTDPEFAPTYLVLGQIYLKKNELVEALKAFKMAFEKDPNFYEAYMSYGAINLNFRGYEDAKTAFEKAVALHPESYDAHMGLGVAYRGLGDFAKARAEYEAASKIDEKRTDYIFNLGLLAMDYENQGTIADYKEAKKIFERFIQHATKMHKKDPDGKRGPEKSWVAKAEDRIKSADKTVNQLVEAEKAMKEMEKLAAEQAKREAEQAELAKQAEELAKKEAEGKQAEEIDEAAVEAELAAEEEAAKAAAEAEKKAKEEAEKAKEEEKAAADDEADKKEDVKL